MKSAVKGFKLKSIPRPFFIQSSLLKFIGYLRAAVKDRPVKPVGTRDGSVLKLIQWMLERAFCVTKKSCTSIGSWRLVAFVTVFLRRQNGLELVLRGWVGASANKHAALSLFCWKDPFTDPRGISAFTQFYKHSHYPDFTTRHSNG